ncbi:MAG: (2Fe-2S)-binding protein [Desulfobacterales bacterium]|jgi:carbon-monoxide dehydrogenase small subunit|nr:(2Fe-2S)-binding protein [Desulfobacter sp.]MDP6395633.1 (2Fe-2S)-binding protein [Desulfobacterales bacterium]MDP6681809.1 (2Fe-2S)-binding protein [Desulfobacterales bacterium]MDP6807980.1 (2Fe-2S)-binding protein [Desulfobacterales bacterium]MDP7355266.1 (2Fe-2S)-binding protein [Desulfobacterales bacterium]|tara:strand:- start:804 stop:1268 length:465 start_codon:yes stop_codon:yes gene_type:complete
MKKYTIHLTVNGEKHTLEVYPNALLLNVIREDIGLTGTKYACGTGQCGACTVEVNGEPVLGCMTLAVAVDGAEIKTIEGLAQPDGTLDPLQEAFLDTNAVQCGFCTSGMILIGKDLLNKNPSPSESEIRNHIKGNLCRCTGYNGITRAILKCSK